MTTIVLRRLISTIKLIALIWNLVTNGSQWIIFSVFNTISHKW